MPGDNYKQRKNGKKKDLRERRVSFCPDPTINYVGDSSASVEQNEIEEALFSMRKFDENALIQESQKPRISLCPLAQNLEIIEEPMATAKHIRTPVKKPVPVASFFKEVPKRNTEIDDHMAQLGIRFLDRIISKKFRDTEASLPASSLEAQYFWNVKTDKNSEQT